MGMHIAYIQGVLTNILSNKTTINLTAIFKDEET